MMKFKKFSNIGIVGYGSYIPRLRLRVEEVARAYGIDGKHIKSSLQVNEKSVADWDEDTATLAYTASRRAVEMAGIKAEKIGAIYVGSESHPYAVKPTSTIVGEALGVGNLYMAADLEFACKAGTAGIQMVASHLMAGVVDYGLAVGADCGQAEPGDILEYTAAAGAGALVLGKREVLAKLEGFLSFTSDTADFWRRGMQKYPRHAGRFTGEPAYFKHVVEATRRFFAASATGPEDYDYVVFHMPNGKFPRRAAKRLGIAERQIEAGFAVCEIGNPYSASSFIGLCRVLDQAESGKRILMTAYGSGAGSDTLAWVTTEALAGKRSRKQEISESKPRYITYGEYRAMGG